MKIPCNIIKDLTDLYIGDMLSKESKAMFEEHLKCCQSCREYAEKTNVAFGAVSQVEKDYQQEDKGNMKRILRKALYKLMPAAILFVAACFVLVLFVHYIIFEHEIYVPYDEKAVYVTETGNLVMPSYCDFSFSYRGTDGEEVYVKAYTTVYNKYIRQNDDEQNLQSLEELCSKEMNTTIYYDSDKGDDKGIILWKMD